MGASVTLEKSVHNEKQESQMQAPPTERSVGETERCTISQSRMNLLLLNENLLYPRVCKYH